MSGDLTFSSKDLEPYGWNPLNEQMERGGKDGTDQEWREDKHGFWWDKPDIDFSLYYV